MTATDSTAQDDADDAQVGWAWPDDAAFAAPVDLGPLIVRDLTEREHSGDSHIATARRRRRRGEAEEPPPAYLLKQGWDAIAERVYSLVARALGLPSAVVRWADVDDFPIAAIRFEARAVRPDRLDLDAGIATPDKARPEVVLRLANPNDYFRHLALSAFAEEGDGEEYMVTADGVLFRIDAANCWHDPYFTGLFRSVGIPEEWHPQHPEDASVHALSIGERVRERDPDHHGAYIATLRRVAALEDLPSRVAHDLRTSPPQSWVFDVLQAQRRAGLTWPDEWPAYAPTPVLSHLAEAFASWIAAQQHALRKSLEA